MRTLNASALAVALLSAMLSTAADARGRHHHHHHRGASVGFFFAPAPVFYPYYYPRYYHPPAVLLPAPSSSPVYIEQSQSAAPAGPASPAQASAAYWYFCRDTQTYYPYVQQCASPWQQVVPQNTPPS